MDRRALLAGIPSAIAGSITGCLGDETDDEPLPTASPEDFSRSIKLGEHDETPTDFPVEYEIDVER